MKVYVIGGGVIGFCSVYYLLKVGYEVIILDKGDFEVGCLFGNVGMIVLSYFVFLVSLGVILKGFCWMFSVSSLFYIKFCLDF